MGFLYREQKIGSTQVYHDMEGEGWMFNKVERVCGKRQRIRIGRHKEYGTMLDIDGLPQMVERDDQYTPLFLLPSLFSLFYPKRPTQGIRVLLLGSGDGAAARLLLKFSEVKSVLLIDISQTVCESTQKFTPFWGGCERDPRLTVIYDDAFRLVPKLGMKYDFVGIDLTDPEDGAMPGYYSAAADLYSKGLALISPLIAAGGVLVMQAGELSTRRWQGHVRLRTVLQDFFPSVYSYSGFVDWIGYPQSFIKCFPESDRLPFIPSNYCDVTPHVMKSIFQDAFHLDCSINPDADHTVCNAFQLLPPVYSLYTFAPLIEARIYPTTAR
ncbi:MAG: hypothetical protein HYW89_04600 [Candidatus Sungiibacteriota bacterium]|uniref:Polyamine aminopropyltransferase n=1 Tax=Candidatus Sungiibacteriota bacterium TaxID=2750080 RepID=A0A7T5UR91_9BACT|nr:MAG: hypothetical protein HYW89_04600 [Candidatus Sungbacteria bacterium]